MSIKNFLLGLLATSTTWAVVDGISTGPLGASRDVNPENQVVLQPADSPSVPESNVMKSGGIYRSYRISVPDDYDESSTWPLIVDFHGRNGDALGQWKNSQYYLNEAGKEYIVVYPNGCFGPGTKGPERAWQGAPYANRSCNDLLFVGDLVNRVQTYYNIDKARIYASGKSNGGGFVDTLACTPTGDLFAAFAMASAALYTDDSVDPGLCQVRPRMILESHGTADDIIPINGSCSKHLPDIAQWTSRWAVRNERDPVHDRSVTGESWGINTTYSCKGSTNMVQQYNVTNLGHCWPSLTNNTDTPHHHGTCRVQTLDFTQAVVEFFAQW